MSEDLHEKRAEKILGYLSICTCPATAAEVASAVNGATRNVRAVLETLARRGKVTKRVSSVRLVYWDIGREEQP